MPVPCMRAKLVRPGAGACSAWLFEKRAYAATSDDSDDDVTDLTARPGDSAHASPRPGAAVKKVKTDPAGDSGGSKATQVPGSSTTLGGVATSLKNILSAVHSYSCHAAPATAAQASQAAQAVQVAQAAAAQAAQAAAAAAAQASRQHAAAPASARTGGGAQGTSTAADRQKEKIDEALDTDVGLEVTNSDEQTFALYRPTSFTHSCFVSHPDEIFETSSMSCLPPPKTGYQLNLCSQTILRGFLTNAQLEAISLACAQHDLRLHGTGERAAFFLGDGPGVGKGRQAAGIIFENFLRGRRKGLWLSASPDLVADARRDLNDIGAENVACWNLKDYPVTVKLDDPRKWDEDRLVEGCLFCTYTLLTSDRDVGKRIDQIVEWCGGESFDGPVILDECHKAKNLGSGRVSSGNGGRGRGRKNKKEKDDLGDSNAWGNKATKAATFVAELQERLPLARIVYVSATGASEPKHFMQLSRLGLWGSGTSFKDAEDFVENIQKGGVGAMELVAMHMKASGQYISRSLSFKTATFELVHVRIDPAFKRKYDGACKLWAELIREVDDLKRQGTGKVPKFFGGILWGAHQRFFGHMVMAAKVPHIVDLVKMSVAEGKCCVIGLQSTGEASSDAAHEQGDDDARLSLDEINSTASSNFTAVVEMCKGFLDEGKRKSLLQRCKQLKLPENPLDDIIHQLGGPNKVAELTGRKMRSVKRGSKWEYVRRFKESNSELTVNIEERKNFQDGKKLVAIISEAASAGISLQADRRVANQKRRVHITLQLPWAADQAVQQMGRSHRANQTSAPEFKLLMTPIGGENRFASAVAARLQSLGALTRGDRRAAGTGGSILQSFAIEGKYGKKALDELVSVIFTGRLTSKESAPEYMTEMFPDTKAFESFREKAKVALDEMGIEIETFEEGARKKSRAEQLRRFLNRLLGVTMDLQDEIFNFFSQLMEFYIGQDKLLGKYEEGICDVAGKNKHVVKVEKLYECPRTGAVTEYVQLASDRGVSWEEANRLLKDAQEYAAEQNRVQDGRPRTDLSGFYVDNDTRHDFKYWLAIRRKQEAGDTRAPRYIYVRPHTGNSRQDYLQNDVRYRTKAASSAALKRWWDGLYELSYDKCAHMRAQGRCPNGPMCEFGKRTKPIHLITGLCLPFWKDLQTCMRSRSADSKRMGIKVVRVQPDEADSKRLVGILVTDKLEEVKTIIKRGTQSDVGIEDRVEHMVDSPFYQEVQVLKLHDCLNPTGQDFVPFDLMPGWDKAADGTKLDVFVQVYSIPFQNAADEGGEVERLFPTHWRSSRQLAVLRSGTGNYDEIPTPMPPRAKRLKGFEHTSPINLSDAVSVGSNRLRIASVGERFCVVVKIMRELPMAEAVQRLVERARKPREWSMGVIQKIMGDENDDCVLTEINVSIKCPLSCGRIKHPCRGDRCEHFNAFDVETYLKFGLRSGRWECPVCQKPTPPWDLAVCPVFEAILKAVETQPSIESCKIDKSGAISTGNNVKVKVKDGSGTHKRVKPVADADDEEEVDCNAREQPKAGGEDSMDADPTGSQEDKLATLKKSGLWEMRQEAEIEFCEPVNVLAARSNPFEDYGTGSDGGGDVAGAPAAHGGGDKAGAPEAHGLPPGAQDTQEGGGEALDGRGKLTDSSNTSTSISTNTSTSIAIDDSEDDSWLG